MEINRLYSLADKENITIINFKMKNKGIIGCIENNYMIGMNYRCIETEEEEKAILAEELGHYYMDATYSLCADKNFINKQEYRAKKWSYFALVPYEKLKSAIKKRN